jgi:predicted DNA-binding protein with PD1-like motif
MLSRTYTKGRKIIGKLEVGDDLLTTLNELCKKEGITMGRVEAIGAVKCARIGFYDQRRRSYQFFNVEGEREILSLMGNISLKEDAPFVHAHIILGDASGAAMGGHLSEGTEVFACEFIIEEFLGEELRRGFDEATGLPLWKK